MRYLEKLYASKNGTNEILKCVSGEETSYFLKVIRKSKTGRVEPVSFEFNGEYTRKSVTGEEKAMYLCLQDYIEKHGAFYRTNNIYGSRNKQGKSVVSVLCEMTFALPEPVRLANEYPRLAVFDPMLRELGVVYNCTWMGFEGNGLFSPYKTRSCIAPGENVMAVTCDGGVYQTEMNDKLIHLLGTLAWGVRNGSLRGRVSRKKAWFSFGEIVFVFYRERLTGHERDVYTALKELRSYCRKNKLEVDHLTENKENNFSYALAALPVDIHAKFKNFRTRIKEPFFFLMAYDPVGRKIKVSCGLRDKIEKRFIFNDHEHRADMELLGSCFDAFKALVKEAGCFMKKPGRESLLYREGMPEKAAEEGSVLETLARAPEETFEKYQPGVFADIPVITER